jgi:hypothetical protein
MQRFFMPVSRCTCAAHLDHDFFDDPLAAAGDVAVEIGQRRLRAILRLAEKFFPFAADGALVERSWTKYFMLSRMLPSSLMSTTSRNLSHVFGLAVRREPHHFPLRVVDPKAEIRGDGAEQQSDRMRKTQLFLEFDLRSATNTHAVVLHSPTPSAVMIAASSNGDTRNALAACERWCWQYRMSFSVPSFC